MNAAENKVSARETHGNVVSSSCSTSQASGAGVMDWTNTEAVGEGELRLTVGELEEGGKGLDLVFSRADRFLRATTVVTDAAFIPSLSMYPATATARFPARSVRG